MGYMCLFQFWFLQGICLGVGLLGPMASLTRWKWVWVNSRSWWWTFFKKKQLYKGISIIGKGFIFSTMIIILSKYTNLCFTIISSPRTCVQRWICMFMHASVMSDSLQSNGQRSQVGSSPWESPVKNGVGRHALLQGIFPTQGSNLRLCVSYTGRFFTTSTTQPNTGLVPGIKNNFCLGHHRTAAKGSGSSL